MFNLQVLEHSFELLRPGHPSQALCIQNLTAVLHARPYTKTTAHDDHRDTWIAIDLPAGRVSDIVSALSDVADSATGDGAESRREKIAIHRTLLAWMIYAQSFLDEAELPGDRASFTRYS